MEPLLLPQQGAVWQFYAEHFRNVSFSELGSYSSFQPATDFLCVDVTREYVRGYIISRYVILILKLVHKFSMNDVINNENKFDIYEAYSFHSDLKYSLIIIGYRYVNYS
jgi:hypothetical protein